MARAGGKVHGIVSTVNGMRIRSVAGVPLTLGIIHLVGSPLTVLLILLPFWYLLFRPWSRKDFIMFVVASLFFLGQNFAVLKTGGFSFRHKDILLMPYYEPFMWGFYYLTITRFLCEPPGAHRLHPRAFLGLLLTGVSFSLFSGSSPKLLASSLVTTGILVLMFHERYDLLYALFAFALGLVVEIFGVSTGLWSYPESDFLGIPYWFATMWVSAGILGRRFLVPLSELLAKKSGMPSDPT